MDTGFQNSDFWLEISNIITGNKYFQLFFLKWQAYCIHFWKPICQILVWILTVCLSVIILISVPWKKQWVQLSYVLFLETISIFWGTATVATAKSLQSCPTLCDPIDGSPPDSSVPGILQARILEWVAISFSRGSSRARNWTPVSCIAERCFTSLTTSESE